MPTATASLYWLDAHPHLRGFWDRILAEPKGDTVRLALADFLEEECNNAAMAGFIRLSVQMEQSESAKKLIEMLGTDMRSMGTERANAIWGLNKYWSMTIYKHLLDGWVEERRRLPSGGPPIALLSRGFVSEVGMSSDAWQNVAMNLIRNYPLEKVHLFDRPERWDSYNHCLNLRDEFGERAARIEILMPPIEDEERLVGRTSTEEGRILDAINASFAQAREVMDEILVLRREGRIHSGDQVMRVPVGFDASRGVHLYPHQHRDLINDMDRYGNVPDNGRIRQSHPMADNIVPNLAIELYQFRWNWSAVRPNRGSELPDNHQDWLLNQITETHQGSVYVGRCARCNVSFVGIPQVRRLTPP